MKKFFKSISVCLTALALIASSTMLFSCSKYKKFHIEENEVATAAVDGYKLTAYFFLPEDGNAVLDLCDEEGKLFQSFEFPSKGEYYTSLDFEFAFERTVFQDMDFDGNVDLYVPCSVTTPNLEGMAWLWDTKEKEFTLSEELSALYELTVYPEDEVLSSQDYSDPEKILCREYQWEDGKLKIISEYTIN